MTTVAENARCTQVVDPLTDLVALRRAIAWQRDAVLTCDAELDRRRGVRDAAEDAVLESLRDRDAAAAHLQHLVDWYDEAAA